MHVFGISLDLSWFLQFILTLFLIALGFLHLVKNTASKYFVVDDSFDPPSSDSHTPSFRKMPGRPAATPDPCAVCGNSTTKNCAGCKAVRYCSADCQRSHWNAGHKQKCKYLRLSRNVNSSQPISLHSGRRGSEAVPSIGNITKHPKEILFPYEKFVDLFNWNKPGFPPCGLLNCGNSCFANVVLQCLSQTRPLVAYLLEKGHRGECRRTDWCFLCELQTHVERARNSRYPFSPLNILSRLPNIGGNLGYGKQEDAHEFMRFAIDTMQSVCLDEFGGEKVLHPSTQETTLIQHIFGGHLESQVICTKCNNISKQYENMMDLTVEIQGDAASLEECLDQFTVREQLHGDNMYKCDGCNDYVMAWKRLTIRRAPNILTIALKRFQSGRFGKLNKRVTFPETLDLSPYMSEAGHENDVYKLYAVVVHVDMLNASYFGHYICYINDFWGNWYRIDDCKVMRADLEEVLSQGAYMLLYSRVCARPSCLKPIEGSSEEQKTAEVIQEEPSAEQSAKKPIEGLSEEQKTAEVVKEEPSSEQSAEGSTMTPSVTSALGSGPLLSDSNSSEEQKTAEVVQEEPSTEQSAEGSTMSPSISSAPGSESLPSDSNASEEQKSAEVVQEEPSAEQSDEVSTMTTPSITSALGSGSLPSDSNSSEEQKTAEVVQEEPSAEQSAEEVSTMMTPSITSALGSGSLSSDSNSSEEQKTAEVVQEEASAECSTTTHSITCALGSGSLPSDSNLCADVSSSKVELSSTSDSEGFEQDKEMVDSDPGSSAMDIEVYGNGCLNVPEENSPVVHADGDMDLSSASETLKPEANSNGSAFCDSSIHGINSAESSGRELAGSHIESHLPLLVVGSESESSMPVQNGMLCQKSEISQDASVEILSSDIILDDLSPIDSTCKPEKKVMGKTSSVKSSSRTKPKPLFRRGFLEKPPPIKCLKRDVKPPSEKGQHAPSGDLSNGLTSEEQKTAQVVQEEPSAEQSAEVSSMTPSVTSAQGSGSLPSESNSIEEQKTAEVVQEEPSAECPTTTPSITSALGSGSLPFDSNTCADVSSSNVELSSTFHSEGFEQDTEMVDSDPSSSAMDIEVYGNGYLDVAEENSLVARASGDSVLSSASDTLKPEANSNGSAFCDSSIHDINSAESSGRELTGSHVENHLPLLGVGSASESSMPVHNGMLPQKSEMSLDASVSTLSSDNPIDSTCKPEKKVMGNTSSSVRSSSRTKPLFRRGFLEKPPPIKCLKRDVKPSSEEGQHALSGDLSNGISGRAKPGPIFQNGFLMKEKRKTNGNVSSDSGNIADLHYGHSGALVSPDEGGLSDMDIDNDQ